MRAVSRLSGYCLVLLLAASQSGCSSDGATPPDGSGGSSNSDGSGGKSSSGGSTGSGGSPNSNGSGGTVGSGGTTSSSGGATGSSSGGAVGSGGKTASGGATGSGGVAGGHSGGAVGSGGSPTSGGGKAGSGSSGGAVGMAGGSGTGNTTGGGGAAAPGAENMGASCNATAAATKKNMKLPNPYVMHDGTMITTMAQWECRRNEIKADLEKYEIGPKQAPPMVAATLSGSKLSVVVTVGSNSITLSSTVSGSGSCIVIGMGGTTSLVTGCQQLAFSTDQVVKYGNDSTQYQSDPFYKLYPSLWQKIGNYSAWAWGVSRLIDGLDQVKDQLKIDMTKIGTWGCSYAGKMSLFKIGRAHV